MVHRLPFPIISVEGDSSDRGFQYGAQAKTLIEGSLHIYYQLFKEAGLEWGQALELGKKFVPLIKEYDSDALEEIKGIAKGAGRSSEEILLLNARRNITYMLESGGRVAEASTEGSTVLAATPEATMSKHMLIGQNVDCLPATKETHIILKEKRDRGPNSVMFLEAGGVGRASGLNSAGIARCGNGLFTDKIRFGVPMQIVERKQSMAGNMAEAIALSLSPAPPRRAGSANLVMADKDGLCVSIEVTSEDANFIYPDNGILVHTNHLLTVHPTVKDLVPALSPSSILRRCRAEVLLAAQRGKITVETMQRILRDHAGKPASICDHTGGTMDWQRVASFIKTIASFIIDVNENTLYIAEGPPCENEYIKLTFEDIM